jgi:hypothetical protein
MLLFWSVPCAGARPINSSTSLQGCAALLAQLALYVLLVFPSSPLLTHSKYHTDRTPHSHNTGIIA